MADFSTITLIRNSDAKTRDSVARLYQHLNAQGYTVLLDKSCDGCAVDYQKDYSSLDQPGQTDLAIIIGGDGTLLRAARMLATHNIPLVGINLGRLGFLVDIKPDAMLQHVDEILKGQHKVEQRFLLTARVLRQQKCVTENNALNDVVISNDRAIRMIEFFTHIDGQFANHERADGLIIASPTGSTAYSLSSGGPILHPTLEAITLVPICPHALNHRPLVVDANSKIEITIDPDCSIQSQVTFDGDNSCALQPGDCVEIRRSTASVKLLHPQSYHFFDILREKLRWGKQPNHE